MQIFKVEGMRQWILYLSRIILSFDDKKMWQLGTFGIPEGNSSQTARERHYRAEISSDWGTCGEHGAQKVETSHFLLLGVQSVTTSNVFCKILPVFLVHASKWLFSQKANIVWVPEFGSNLRVSLNTTLSDVSLIWRLTANMKLASLEHSLWTQLSCYWGDDLLNWCLATWPVCSELGCRPASLSPFSLFSLLNIIGRLLPPRPICSEGFLITSSRFDVFHGSLCSLGRKTEAPIIIAVAEAELLLFHWTSKGIIRRPRGWLFKAKHDWITLD